MNWTRVTRRNPCVICSHDSWCGVSPDGRQAICMRVESDHPTKNGGWLHNLSGTTGKSEATRGNAVHAACFPATTENKTNGVQVPTAQTSLDCDKLLANWRQHQNGQLELFAATIGVSQDALRLLGCVWASEHRAFAFPMRDASGRVIGIRLRNERGDKWAVKGSRQGLFLNVSVGVEKPTADPATGLPEGMRGSGAGSGERPDAQSISTEKGGDAPCQSEQSRTSHQTDQSPGSNAAPTVQALSAAALLIVEGPTDTAAAIDLGYRVIGRPACVGCEDMIVQVVKSEPMVPVFIIADADEPGQRGARSLQAKLGKAKIITLPAKDLRAFVTSGGTNLLLNEILNAAL